MAENAADRRIISDITEFIFISDIPSNADAIFLPGGSHPEQPEYAARLYLKGYAPVLMPSGGVSVKMKSWPGVRARAEIYNGDYHSDCEFYTNVLIKNGVPRSAIIGEDKSGHTRDNAFFTRKTAEQNSLNIQTAMIVCKSFHARRCLMFYQMAFPDTKITVCPVDCYGITRDGWYKTPEGLERVMGELARCGSQFLPDIKEYLK